MKRKTLEVLKALPLKSRIEVMTAAKAVILARHKAEDRIAQHLNSTRQFNAIGELTLLLGTKTNFIPSIDPEIMQAGITLAGYHIEKGARTFSDFAKAMVDDLGDIVKPYLKSWYSAIKYAPRAASFKMDSMSIVENADIDNILEEQYGTAQRSNNDMERNSQDAIIPVMSEIFRIAAKMGYIKFADAAKYVMQQIRSIAGSVVADKISIDNLQAGYINVAKEIGGDKHDAMSYDSIQELE